MKSGAVKTPDDWSGQPTRRTRTRPEPVRWPGTLLLVLLLGAALACMFALYRSQTRLAEQSGLYRAEGQATAAILIISESDRSGQRYAGFQQALAEAGLSSLHVPVANVSGDHLSSFLLEQSERLQQASVTGDRIWLLFHLETAARLAELDPGLDHAGLILLFPADLTEIVLAEWQDRALSRPFMLMGSDDPQQASFLRQAFEQLTGEDAWLFPGSPAAGAGPAVQYRSADGRTVLYLYPHLLPERSAVALRPLADLAMEITAFSGQEGSSPASSYALAGSWLLSAWRLYLFSLILLLAAGACLFWLSASDRTVASRADPGVFARTGLLRFVAIWPLALLLAAGLAYGLLTRYFSVGRPLVLAWLILPGCYGLAAWITNWSSRDRSTAVSQDQPADGTGASGRSKWLPLVLPGSFIMTLLFICWRWLLFGWYPGNGLAAAFIFAGLLWNLPGIWFLQSMPGQAGSGRRKPAAAFLLMLLRQGPFLLAPVIFSILYGLSGLVIALFSLLFLLWADQAGKAVAIVSGQGFPGRLIRSLLLTLAWTHPALLPSLLNGAFY